MVWLRAKYTDPNDNPFKPGIQRRRVGYSNWAEVPDDYDKEKYEAFAKKAGMMAAFPEGFQFACFEESKTQPRDYCKECEKPLKLEEFDGCICAGCKQGGSR